MSRLLPALFCVPILLAQDPAALFRDRIQPVLKKDCLGCHGEGQVLSKLDMRTRAALLKGGARGPSIAPGNAAGSILYQAIAGSGPLKMPPIGKASPEFVDAVKVWIDAGAPWAEPAVTDRWSAFKEEDLWAFRPLRAAQPGDPNSIDAFLERKLAEKKIAAAPPADRRTLLRRATLDLTGLPPTYAETKAFADDESPGAWETAVDRLLASPRYGERWGRHWLDVVRYADTNGYSNDFERPNAWRYRDYVIRAFNNDKPYDRFLREQIAGDELFPGDPEALIATGFLRAGPWEHTGMSVEAVTRQMFLDDVTHGVAATFLGLTLGCARCHDHKFDPLPTKDYYRMQAIFATTEFARPRLPFLPTENTSGLAAGRAGMKAIAGKVQAHIDAFNDLSVANAMRKHGVTKPADLPAGVRAKAIRDREGIGPDQFEELKLYQKHMQLYQESLDRYEPKAFAVSSGPRDGATDGGPNLKYPKHAEYTPPEVHVLPGGNVQSPGEEVSPGVLSLVERYAGLPSPEVPASVEGRRAVLADWIADPRHPLTARVMVNRVWQYHFGRGIAADANNFGKMGARPSHPELLDWLAARFIASGWSVKKLHRMILLSDAYRRSSVPTESAAREDPANLLLSHFTPHRVEAEVLRDSLLAAAGELSPDAGGPGVYPQINEDVARQPQHRMGSLAPAYLASPQKRDRNRRTIYTFQQRTMADPLIEVFNGPSPDFSCERREATIVPTQAFALFNSQLAHDMALALAAKASTLEAVFVRALGRPPTPEEASLAGEHWKKMLAHHRANPPGPRKPAAPLVHKITSELTGELHSFTQQGDPDDFEHNLHPSEVTPETRALADVALALLNSNEFAYVY
ncbi:MAG: PSD1 and planctomycete cytochrome C domain-containing protein [Bryobacteraceae bacterium]